MSQWSRTRIKICGVKDSDTAVQCARCGADAIGFVFAKMSPRTIQPDAAASIMMDLPPWVSTVGLMVNPSLDTYERTLEACPTTYTQLHGNEGEAFVGETLGYIIKAIKFDPATIAGELERWAGVPEVDAILVDGSSGGQGVALDWDALAPHVAACEKPIVLAGGLTPENVGEAIRTVRPFGVDVSSGVESDPGEKDPGLIRAFCEAVRSVDAELAQG